MSTVLVTGATGLIGSNVCAEVIAGGMVARALVRPGSDAQNLEAMGVEIARGDIVSPREVRAAAEGCDYCIHTAALVVGGPIHPVSDYDDINVTGSGNVLEAAEKTGLRRTVMFGSSAAFDRSKTLRDDGQPSKTSDMGDPYARTKWAAYELTMSRVAAGIDAVMLLPGATVGPAPTLGRAVEAPGFNSRVVLALQGKITEFPSGICTFVLASDVARASVSALTRGVAGEMYLAYGRPEDLTDSATFLTMACEAGNVSHRVRSMTKDDLQRPEVLERWGPAILRTALPAPDPLFINQQTVERLGHDPGPLTRVVNDTVEWMVAHRLVAGLEPAR